MDANTINNISIIFPKAVKKFIKSQNMTYTDFISEIYIEKKDKYGKIIIKPLDYRTFTKFINQETKYTQMWFAIKICERIGEIAKGNITLEELLKTV